LLHLASRVSRVTLIESVQLLLVAWQGKLQGQISCKVESAALQRRQLL